MERLTIKAPSGLIHLKDNKEMTVNTAIKKLSDYEEIGTVEDFKKAIQNVKTLSDMYEKLNDKEVAEYHELAEYKELEKQGKLPKMPCAVGDTVYRINVGKKEPIIPMRVIGIAVREGLIIQTKDIADDGFSVYSQNSIGKTVFITEKEAEAALKEWREANEID